MAKGIIYLMSTAVPGLIKIGKTTMANYSQRMYNLESNGYRNVSSLKRAFAIEVEGYDEKELLLHTIFEKSRVADTELFAIDANVVIQLLLPPIPKYFSKKAFKRSIIPIFFSSRLLFFVKRLTGGIILSISVPVVLISPC